MQSASFLKRILALVYDSLLIAAIVLVLSLLLVLVNGGYSESGSFVSFIQFFILVFTGPIFYSYFWIVNKGQTTGMQAWRIKLVTTDETELNINKTMLRCLISTISFACLGLGYLWILYHKDDLSWSDILTKTKVIKTNQ
tara:strand:- start:309 stop:728 length:420 start_codon:yes stop_codon:yes gene_type:complete